MRIQWTPYAFVRLVLPLIGGILSANHFPVSIDPLHAFWGVSVLMMLFILAAFLRRRHGVRINGGWAGLLAIYLLGYVAVPFRSEAMDPDHLVHRHDTIQNYTAVVASYPGKGTNTWKQVAEVKSLHTKTGWRRADGKVLLYFDLDGYDEPFRYGTVLLLAGSPGPVPGPSNPEEFDYRRFLALQHILYQQYVRGDEAIPIGNDPPSTIMSLSLAARSSAVEVFRRFMPGGQEQAVASALVLGDKDGLDDDLYAAYTGSGTMHVLAVSGLHVGIIYSMIMFVFGPIRKIWGGKVCLAVLSVVILWGYAFVTGLSPSVLRATMMFSFVTIAGPWGRRANIYNTFAVSAFVLLFYEPNLIYSVSFQLSYVAVLGIVYFYPRLVTAWQPASWLGRKVWETSCVSVAAQLATFPVALFYFHQFPVYFLLGNLLAIPLSFAILVVGISMLMVAAWTPIVSVVGHLLYYLVQALNKSVMFSASLPFGVVDGIYITPLQCWMLAGLVFTAVALIEFRKANVLYAGLLFSVVFAAEQWKRETADTEKCRMVVYQVRGHYGIEFTAGARSYFLADTALATDRRKVSYHIAGYRTASGIETILDASGAPFVRELKGSRLICWKEYTIIHIFDREFKWPPDLAVDCTIVSNNAVRELPATTAGITSTQWVVDGSNSDYVARRLEQEASEHAVALHATGKSGAYIKEI